MTRLQLALDLLDFKAAKKIAKETKDYVDIIEAGTPLIKQNGLSVVTKLKQNFPDQLVLADLKTADTGALEVSMAKNAGADITTIMGSAPLETLSKGIKKTKGIKVAVDTIGMSPVSLLKKLGKLKPDMIVVHRGIDQGTSKPFKLVKTSIPLAVAGGINATVANKLTKKVDTIIVGRFITGAKNPGLAAKKVREAIE